MNSISVFGIGKLGLHYINNLLRRRVVELKVDAQQHRLGLLRRPERELITLIRQAERMCSQVKNDAALGEYFTSNNPWSNRPWREFDYWNGWYALAKIKQPSHILEIGTAFGYSTIALARGAGEALQLLVSLDLGSLGRLFTHEGYPQIDNLPYVNEGISRYRGEYNLNFEYSQFEVNTQPPPYTDNDGNPVQCPYWRDDKELIRLLSGVSFDIILIDGKHTEDGLYNDLCSFFACGASNCLIVCDDIQHIDAAKSLCRFVRERKQDIADYCLWKHLHSNAEYAGTLRRDQGLILKK